MISAKKAKEQSDKAGSTGTPLIPIIRSSISLACSKGKNYAFITGKKLYHATGATGKVLDVVRDMGYNVYPSDDFGVLGVVVYWGTDDDI